MSTAEYSRPVRLSRRSRQGVVAGLDGWASGALALAGAIAVLAAIGEGFIGFFMSALLWLPIGLSAFIPLHGFSMPKVAVLWMSMKVRHAVGATQTRYRPERPQIADTLNLPGVRANVQVWDIDGMAAAYNPIDKTVSITAELEVDGFLMLDTPERYDLSLQWGTVLASFTQRPGIKRVTLQERTVPTTIQTARQFYEETVRPRQLDTT